MFSDDMVNLFWSKVYVFKDENNNVQYGNCMLWIGLKNDNGYGLFNYDNIRFSAHRLSYEMHYMKNPDGFEVCHACNTPSCVNPYHLFLGTHENNMKYMVETGRSCTGSKNCGSKITEENIEEILIGIISGKYKTAKAISDIYKIHDISIREILNGNRWVSTVAYICNKLNIPLDQIRDKIIGNGMKGSNNKCSKLNEELVIKIKHLLKSGISGSEISRQVGIHQTVISKINVGKLWNHVKI